MKSKRHGLVQEMTAGGANGQLGPQDLVCGERDNQSVLNAVNKICSTQQAQHGFEKRIILQLFTIKTGASPDESRWSIRLVLGSLTREVTPGTPPGAFSGHLEGRRVSPQTHGLQGENVLKLSHESSRESSRSQVVEEPSEQRGSL